MLRLLNISSSCCRPMHCGSCRPAIRGKKADCRHRPPPGWKCCTWHAWEKLCDYAHLSAASRPGFAIGSMHLPPEVAREFSRRAATAAQMHDAPNGLSFLASNLAIDVSATRIRSAMQHGASQELLKPLLPAAVLDYIEQHHLYRT